MKTKFNLEEYRKNPNRRVVTGEGKAVKIADESPTIFGYVEDNTGPYGWNADGREVSDEENDNIALYFDDEDAAPESGSTLHVEAIIENDITVGVKIPIINKVIYFADIKENIKWDDAVKYAKSLGKKIPTYRKLCILAYFREEIEKIYPKFKDLEYIWGEQSSAYYAWLLANGGNLNRNYKYGVFTVVPLADLDN